MWTGFHTNHVSYGDFASSGAVRFRVQIWYEKHGFSAGSFDFGTNFQNIKA